MTEAELTTTVQELKSGMQVLTQEWGQFLEVEARRREEDALERRKRESSESQKAAAEVAEWEKRQTFLAKHGMKLATVIFSIVSAGLAWYGSKIRSEVQAEQREKIVETNIRKNTDNFTTFKDETFADFKKDTQGDINALQRESVNQTLMIDKGFERVDTIMIKATKLTEDDLPEKPPEFKEAVDNAKALKIHAEKFGKEQ